MSAHDQLALDGEAAAVVPSQREPGTDRARERSERRGAENDRWLVSGLFVQPREIDDEERSR